MADKDYIYAVSRVRFKEKYCLDRAFISSLASARSYGDALKLLADKGIEGNDIADICGRLEAELDKFMAEIVSKSDMAVVFAENDFHNLKAAVRSSVFEKAEDLYLPNGALDAKDIESAVKEERFEDLPDYMRDAAKDALKRLRETGDGQLCDIIIDKAMAKYMLSFTEGFFGYYASHTVSVNDLKTAVRGSMMKKKSAFFDEALIDTPFIDAKKLKAAALSGNVGEYISSTDYKKCAEALKTSAASFERACDDVLMAKVKEYKREFFGIEPIAAYYLGKQSEIKTLRVILTAKLYGVGDDYMKERLREAYV